MHLRAEGDVLKPGDEFAVDVQVRYIRYIHIYPINSELESLCKRLGIAIKFGGIKVSSCFPCYITFISHH